MKDEKPLLLAFVVLLAMPVFSPAAAMQNGNAAAQGQNANPALPSSTTSREEGRITHEVRHELLSLPQYTIWDWLAFRVDGSTVELLGDVITPGLEDRAVKAVKGIEGVEKVVDHINQLPPLPADDRIRRATARAIFNSPGLLRYSWSAVPSIHIIVNKSRVRLEGIVASQGDKDLAGLRAHGVPGVFEVTNNLQVVKD